MTINCQIGLQNNSEQARFLVPSITETGNLASPFSSELFKFESTKADTATFNFKILSANGIFELYFELFRKTDSGFLPAGASIITEFNTNLNFNLIEDYYYFCIHGNTAISFEITLLITNYVPIAIFRPEFYSGEIKKSEMSFLIIPCNEEITYEILDGKLPPNLSMTGTGRIDGIVDKMDPNTKPDVEPSFTWWKYDLNEEEIIQKDGDVYTHWWEKEIKQTEIITVSTSYDWPILVRAAFLNDPAVYTDRWFKICVRNNWTFDRDNFLRLLECLETVYFDECPDLTINPTVQPEPEELCPPCPEPESRYQPLTTKQLKDLCDTCEIKPEFQGIIDLAELQRQANILSVQEIDERTDQKLKELTVQLCELDCETKTFVELQELNPDELCPPCDVKPKILEPEKQPCFTIEYHLTRLLYQMEESKRPRDGFECLPHGQRYSERLRTKPRLKLKTPCEECK